GQAGRRCQGDGEESRQEGEEGREEGREEGGEGRSARRRSREVTRCRRRSARSSRPRGWFAARASPFGVGKSSSIRAARSLLYPKASPGGQVHSELPKEITMIRTIAVAVALCLASFGAFAQA